MEGTPPELEQLDAKIRHLRALYEQYFQGIERIEPLKQRDAVKKLLDRLLDVRRNNTAFKFRVANAKQTFMTYERYWDRIARQIEEGTYARDRKRAARRLQEKSPNGHAHPADGVVYDPSVIELHRNYLRARSKVGDSRPVPIESFARSVEKQTAAIKDRYRCANVEFRVSVKEGRVVLKAQPK